MIDLSTQEKKNEAINNLMSLKTHPGWLLVTMNIDDNMEIIKPRLLKGEPNQTLEEVHRLQDVLSVHQEFIDTPDVLIEKLKDKVVQEMPNDDPFDDIIKK